MKITRVYTGTQDIEEALKLGISLGANGYKHLVLQDGETAMYGTSDMALSDDMIDAVYNLAIDGDAEVPAWLEMDYEANTVTNTLTGLVVTYVDYVLLTWYS